MKIGTRSVLFGAHQFLIHPLFLALAWWRLYGFPWNPRLWVAFVIHDLGYWGKSNMDGEEGESHPLEPAILMSRWFDKYTARPCKTCCRFESNACWDDRTWGAFTLCHSRFVAKRLQREVSRLCVADKMATIMMPAWLYIALTTATGEIREYMDPKLHEPAGGKYAKECKILTGPFAWFYSMRHYMRGWINEHRRIAWMPPENPRPKYR
jgi:hypothetical protein